MGSSMSANLLAGVKPTVTQYGSMADGVITSSTPKDNWTDVATWPITADTLAENQTMHIGISAKWHGAAATTGAAWASVKYADTAGNTNSVNTQIDCITTEWQRLSLSAVIPSGMRIVDFHISGANLDAAYDAANPVLSYGSTVTLASSAHTPYATQDHVSTTYATKASQKILSDSITSEVNARAKTDGAVSELSSKLLQTVDGINVSLDRLAATDKQIHSWFDFGSDASGNPKLSMGSSSSPIVGEYSNTGTAYKSRSGATLLALDAANSTTTADHMLAKDIAIGKWQWVPTNGGNNLTLVWKG